MRKTYDVVALIFGLLLSCVALGSLWLTFVGPLNWQVIRIVAPMGRCRCSRPRPFSEPSPAIPLVKGVS
jgi:hypothetical protein